MKRGVIVTEIEKILRLIAHAGADNSHERELRIINGGIKQPRITQATNKRNFNLTLRKRAN